MDKIKRIQAIRQYISTQKLSMLLSKEYFRSGNNG